MASETTMVQFGTRYCEWSKIKILSFIIVIKQFAQMIICNDVFL